MAEPSHQPPSERRVLELFAGIGGLHCALQRCGVPHRVYCAFDVDESALRCYRHNLADTKTSGADIVSLSVASLESYGADTWLLSPPCQPFTRQGHMQGADDKRSSALMHVISLLRDAPDGALPDYLLLENVVGFESSTARAALLAPLRARGYRTRELWVSPSDVGVPNQRTRYFLLARRLADFAAPEPALARLVLNAAALDRACADGVPLPPPRGAVGAAQQAQCEPLASYLEQPAPQAASAAAVVAVPAAGAAASDGGSGSGGGEDESLRVATHVLERYGAAMDVVGPHDRRSCCFTKNYTRYFKGAGSVLAPALPAGGAVGEPKTLEALAPLSPRFFSPREIANLHGFPAAFAFPDAVSRKKRYELLGNSLSVQVVARLLTFLFATPATDQPAAAAAEAPAADGTSVAPPPPPGSADDAQESFSAEDRLSMEVYEGLEKDLILESGNGLGGGHYVREGDTLLTAYAKALDMSRGALVHLMRSAPGTLMDCWSEVMTPEELREIGAA